jgi:Right handed beta helix region
MNHSIARLAPIVLCLGLAAVGCQVTNEAYDPGRLACAMDMQCPSETPICDTGPERVCVQCTAARPDECKGKTPVCGSDRACQACVTHADCPGKSCLPDGSCGDDKVVAYVATDKTDNSCNFATPCGRISDALKTGRPYVRISGPIDEAVMLDSRDVTFLADPGATLTRSSNGILMEIKGTSKVAIYDLEITGASGATGFGISMPSGNTASLRLVHAKLTKHQAGALVASGGSVSIFRSIIADNNGGGVSLMTNKPFAIVGNVFFNNGDVNTIFGGLFLNAIADAGNRLELNSFTKNDIQGGAGAAISCNVGGLTAKSNILFDNGPGNQFAGTCAHSSSIVSPGALPVGDTNTAADPLFLDGPAGNLHISSTSPARDKADPAIDLRGDAALDIDRDKRTAPVDIGADEVN